MIVEDLVCIRDGPDILLFYFRYPAEYQFSIRPGLSADNKTVCPPSLYTSKTAYIDII